MLQNIACIRISGCLTAQRITEREIRTNAECSGSSMIFSRINWPNARRKEATWEKSCENDRPARRVLFMTGLGKLRSFSTKRIPKRKRASSGREEGGEEAEKTETGSKGRGRVARKIEKHLYARTNVTHPPGCSELRQ